MCDASQPRFKWILGITSCLIPVAQQRCRVFRRAAGRAGWGSRDHGAEPQAARLTLDCWGGLVRGGIDGRGFPSPPP